MFFKTNKLALFCAILIYFAVVSYAYGANFFIDGPKAVKPNEPFQVYLYVDTKGERLNAFEGSLIFSHKALKIERVKTSGSILTFWVKDPLSAESLSKAAETGRLDFAGIVPGGLLIAKGQIFSIVFSAAEEGKANIGLTNEKAYLNDSGGSPAKAASSGLELTISSSAPSALYNDAEDHTPPEPFEVLLARDPSVLDGKYFAVFSAKDKGTGIDHYEIAERREFPFLFFTFGEQFQWKDGQSPYVLSDQSLKSTIYVKAIDEAKNEQIAKLFPNPLPRYDWYIFLLSIVVILFYIVMRKKGRHEVPGF